MKLLEVLLQKYIYWPGHVLKYNLKMKLTKAYYGIIHIQTLTTYRVLTMILGKSRDYFFFFGLSLFFEFSVRITFCFSNKIFLKMS